MKLSIIIPTYNHLHDCLIPCLNSLTEYCDLKDTEVIVVANGCIDKTEETVLDSGFQLVSIDRPVGFAKAFEAGVQASQGKYVMSLHNDVTFLQQPKNNVIETLLKEIDINTFSLVGTQKRYDSNTRRYYIPLYCAMFRKYALERIGLGNNRNLNDFAGSCEEIAISARLIDHHFSIGQISGNELLESPPTPIRHIGGVTSSKMHNYEYRLARNAAVFRQKFRKSIKTSIIVVPYNLEQLQATVKSIWKHTDVSTEVLIVHSAQNEEMNAYINRLVNCGPYKQVFLPVFPTIEQAINFALPLCEGEVVVSLTKPVPWTWIDCMTIRLLNDDSTVLSGSQDLSSTVFIKDAITYLGGFSKELWSSIRRQGLRIHEEKENS